MLSDNQEGQNTDKVSHELWKANSYFFLVSTTQGYWFLFMEKNKQKKNLIDSKTTKS